MRAKRLAARAAAQAAGVKVGRFPGQPDGMRKKEFIRLRDIGLEKTKKVMAYMAHNDKFIADNDKAFKALETAVEILEIPGQYVLKLQAAKVILEYTQKKPVAATAMTLTTAEAFLDDIYDKADTPADTDAPKA